MRLAIRRLRRQGSGSFTPEDVLAVKERVSLAFDAADVLGILPGDNFTSAAEMWMERLMALYASRGEAGRPAASLVCSHLHHDVVDQLPGLLTGRPVSVISCRDLKPVLEGEWGLEDVAVYRVPSQNAVRDVDSIYEAAMHDVPIWPDGHARVHAALTVREPGEMFLIGAGVFGKDLCIRVRELGGIALDMGSALDRIAGKITSRPQAAGPRSSRSGHVSRRNCLQPRGGIWRRGRADTDLEVLGYAPLRAGGGA
jgi:hypothetical protein